MSSEYEKNYLDHDGKRWVLVSYANTQLNCSDDERRTYNAEISTLKTRIAELEAERRWIPVTERLPELGGEVYTCQLKEEGI